MSGFLHMTTLIIVNNVAAKARAAWPIIQNRLAEAGIDYDVYHTTDAGDATTRTRAALAAGTTTIAVVGGDGSLSEAAEGFFEFDPDVRHLPRAINAQASLA